MRLPLDLRLIGWAFEGVPVSQLATRTAPFALAGALVTIVLGMALYAAVPGQYSSNPAFAFKIAALAAALANAWWFHAVLARRMREWDTAPVLPVRAQASGYVSLVAWVAIVVAGRLVAFTGN